MQRTYREQTERWNNHCKQCISTRGNYRRLKKAAAKAATAPPAAATPSPQCSLSGYAGTDEAELVFIPRLLAAVKADPVLMASWESEKDDLFSDIVLLKCRRKTKTDDLEKNLESLRGNLAIRIEYNAAAVRDDILKHDKAVNELPLYETWKGSGIICPASVNHRTRTFTSVFRNGCGYALSTANYSARGKDALVEVVEEALPFTLHFWIILQILVRRTKSLYRSTSL